MKRPRPPSPETAQPLWMLRLYIAGRTPKALTAFANLKNFAPNTSRGGIRWK